MASERILVIDDNPQNLKLVRIVLTKAGYQVATAGDGEEAWRMMESLAPQLILMDLQLPGLDGLTLTRRLKEHPTYRDIIVIALTAYAMTGDDQKAFAAGCEGYISKPIDIETLPRDVAGYLARSAGSTTAAADL